MKAFRFALPLGLAVLSAATWAGELTVTPIYVQNVGDPYPPVPPARMVATQGTLVVHPHDSDAIDLYSESTLQKQTSISGFRNALFLTANEQGWVAACVDGFPAHLKTFQISNPTQIYDYDFGTDDIQGCSGMAIQMQGNRPLVWTGSTGTRQVLKIDVLASKMTVVMPKISGPVDMAIAGNILITANSLVGFGTDLPLIYDISQNKTLVGDPSLMGIGAGERKPTATTLAREYIGRGFVDEVTQTISYLMPSSSGIKLFDLKQPQEATAVVHPISVTVPSAMLRYGKCLVVMGSSNDQHQKPQWSVVRAGSPGEFSEIFSTPYATDLSLRASIFIEVGAHGELFLSHQRGVSRVTGLFDGLGC